MNYPPPPGSVPLPPGSPPPRLPPAGGTPPRPFGPPRRSRPNVCAILSLIFGLVLCVPGVTALAAVITGLLGLRHAGRSGGRGRAMAVFGLLLGVAGLLLWGVGGWVAFDGSRDTRPVAGRFAKDLHDGDVEGILARNPSLDRAEVQAAADELGTGRPVQVIYSLPLGAAAPDAGTRVMSTVLVDGPFAQHQLETELRDDGEGMKVVGFKITW